MSDFSFVFSLFSLLLGLAMAEVLRGLGTALQSRGKVRIGTLTPLLGLAVALDLTSFWGMAWTIRDAIPADYISLLYGFVVTSVYYLIARVVFPLEPAENPDYDNYYFTHKRLVLGGVMLCNVLAIAGQLALGGELVDTTLERLALGLFFVPLAAAIWVSGKRANIALLLVVALYYPVMALVGLTT